MAIFGRKKSKGENDSSASNENPQVNTDNTENSETGVSTFNIDGIVHESLQQEVVEAIGQGSEDVKRIVVTLEGDDDLIFIIAGGIIKNIDSPVTNYDIGNRLNWVDYKRFTDEQINTVVNIFAENDFFDALVKVVDEIGGEDGIALAEKISETYSERSMKSIAYANEKKILRIETDWTLESDTDVIEAYSGFNLDPKDIDFTVASINMKVQDLFDEFDEGANTIIYANDNTDYEQTDTDVSRYVLGAVQTSLDPDNASNGVSVADLAAYSDGFQITDVLDEVIRLLELEKVSLTDPYVIVEEEPEPEIVEEEFIEEEPEPEPEIEEVVEEEEEEEELPANEEILDVPYPAAIEGGTTNLGGALVAYINQLIELETLSQSVVNRLEYTVEYNTLFEQSVQGVETAMVPVVRELNRSVNVYKAFTTLDSTIGDFSGSSSSNLHTAVYHLEVERNDLNSARVNALTELYTLINENVVEQEDLLELINDVIRLKIDGINNVQDLILGNDTSLYSAEEELIFDKTTVPTYYAILEDLGLEES